jgi:hypothetical protein
MKAKKVDPENLPIYEILISEEDDTGMKLISLVDRPAIGVMGMKFNEEKPLELYFRQEEEKRIIIGPALIPDLKIKRGSSEESSYFVYFSKDTIEKMVEKFNASGTNRRINIDHSNKMVDAYIMEDWIIEDPVYDKSRKYGFELPVGTYMIKVKIEDQEFWENVVKAEGKYGFSIEGFLNQKLVKLADDFGEESEEEDEDIDIEDLGLIDLLEIFEMWDPELYHKCDEGCTHHKFQAKEGLVHPNCRCDLMLGDFQKSAPYIGKDGKEYPCEVCDEAERQWRGRGFFRDVFGTKYTYIDRFPYYVKRPK